MLPAQAAFKGISAKGKTMARDKKPKPLGLEIIVRHPESEVEVGPRPIDDDEYLDADGHDLQFEMAPMPGEAICWLAVRRGMAPREAAKLLRKIADHLENHGAILLNLKRGECGEFDANGEPLKSLLSLDYDESGNELQIPEIEDGPKPDPEDEASEEWKDGETAP